MDSVLGSPLDNPSEFKFITEKIYRTMLIHPMILLGCAYT